ncbi:MAG: WG repeat-containing protein [Aeriscardovia sp.]|nr:WG repeat-containing protein [Aeriscardovia sp.]
MKKILSVILALAMSLSAVLLAVPQTAFAETSSDAGTVEFTAEKTDIQCSSVYNRGGYGVVSFSGPEEIGGTDNYWTWYGLVDANGNYVIPAKPMENDPRANTFDNTFFVSDGIICDYKKGYYNLDGSEAFPMDFFEHTITAEDVGVEGAEIEETYYTIDAAFPFFKGTALVQMTAHASFSTAGQGGTASVTSPVFVIDTQGHVLQEIEDWQIRLYGGQGMVIENANQPIYRRYDKTLVFDVSDKGYKPFNGTGAFFGGYAWVISNETNLVGYINTAGEEVIPCEYEVGNPFGGGLANVKKDGKYGYIDVNNNVIIPFEYDDAYGACDGIAVVGNDGKYGFVDYDNNVVLPLEWDDLSTFENNVAYGIKDGELYVITKNDTSTDPYLAGETFWLGMEYRHSPHIQNANPNDLEITAVFAADTDIIGVEQISGQGTKISDYILHPLKAGSTVVRVEYLLNGKAGVATGTYTVKPFPAFITNLAIDGQAQAADAYTNKNYYDIYSYKGTAPNVKFIVGDGWRLDNAYGFRQDESGSPSIIIKSDEVETGWTFEFPETSKDLYTFYYFKNDLDEEIMYSVRFHREDDPFNPPAPSAGWDETHTHYIYDNGEYAKGYVQIQGDYYYFDPVSGELQKGWIETDLSRFYADPKTGILATGWQKIDGYWYYFDKTGNSIFDGTETIDGKLYFFDVDGRMLTGWIKDGDTWYFANSGGDLATGWLQSGTTWYYMDPATGEMQTGFVTVGSAKYYMAPSGAMMTGWIKDNDNWYFANGSGVIQTGWVKSGTTWYYMDSEGVMQTGWLTISGAKYYMAASGAMQTGWVKDGVNWYYAAASGVIQTGWVKVGATWYYMNTGGVMQTGWVKVGNSWYYMNASGAMQTGWVKVGNFWYYMNASGAMQTGWVKIGSTWYYMNASGAMQTGWLQLGGNEYFFNSSGAMQTGWAKKSNGIWYYAKSDGTMREAFVRSVNSNIVHKQDCHYAEQISSKNLQYLTDDAATLRSNGYRSCTDCHSLD